jgi:hypothetical protein
MNLRPALLILSSVALLAPSASFAQSNSQSSNNGVNNQSNSGTVIQNPSGGSQTNINQNNAFSSTYSFGPGISCPTPSLAANLNYGGGDAWGGGYSSGSGSYGASLSYIHPLGGSIGNACEGLVTEITRQRQLDTDVNLIKVCADMAANNIQIDLKAFPEFKVCESVHANGRTAVLNTGPVFSEPSSALPVIPVR